MTEQSVAESDFPTLRQIEDAHIRRAVEKTAGNLSEAARVLGVDRRTLYRRLHQMGATFARSARVLLPGQSVA